MSEVERVGWADAASESQIADAQRLLAADLLTASEADLDSVLLAGFARLGSLLPISVLGECTEGGPGACWHEPGLIGDDDLAAVAERVLATPKDAGPVSFVDADDRTVLVIPVVSGSWRGACVVAGRDGAGIDPEAGRIVESVAAQVASARARLRAESQVADRLALQEFVNELATLAARGTIDDAEEVQVEICRRLVGRFGLTGVGVWHREGMNIVRDFGARADGSIADEPLAVQMTEDWLAAVEHPGFGFVTLGELRASGEFPDEDDAGALVATMTGPDGLVGVLGFADPSRRRWSADEVDTARSVAHLVQQLRTRVAVERLVHRRLELEELGGRIAARAVLTDVRDSASFMSVTLADLVDFFGLSEASTWLADERGLRRAGVHRADGQEPSIDEVSLPAHAFSDGRSWVALPVADAERAVGLQVAHDRDAQILAFSASDRSGLLGALTITDPTCRAWTTDEIAALESISGVLGQLRSRLLTEAALQRQRAMESVLAEMASDLVHIGRDDARDAIIPWLDRLREQSSARSVAVWTLERTAAQLECVSESTADGRPLVGFLSPIPWRHRAISAVEAAGDIEHWRVGDLLGDDSPHADASLLLFPVVHEGDLMAVTVIDAIGGNPADDTVTAFRSAAAVIGQLRRRLLLERQAEQRQLADRLLADIARELLERPVEESDAAVVAALRHLAEFFDSPRVSLWKPVAGADEIRCRGIWAKDGAEAAALHATRFPESHPMVVASRSISSATVYPVDDASGTNQGDLDLVVAPLRVGDDVDGALLLALPRPAAVTADLDLHLDVIDAVSLLIRQFDTRTDAELAVIRRLEMEDLLARFATRLIRTTADVDDGARTALEELVAAIGVDHASFWRVDTAEASTHLDLVLEVHRAGVRPIPESMARQFVTVSDDDVVDRWDEAVSQARDWSIDEDPDAARVIRAVTDDAPRRVAVMAHGDHGGDLSVFMVSRPGDDPLDDHEIRMLRSAANILAQHEARMTAERWFIAAFDASPVAISMRDDELRLVSCNAAYEELLGRTEAEMKGGRIGELIGFSAAETAQALRDVLAGTIDHETAYIRPDGSLRWAEVTSISVEVPGRPGHLMLSYSNDVTEQRSGRELLEFQASHDELTGLPNRRALVAEIETELQRSRDCAILVLDLDRFKIVNDSLGHSVGDQLLVTGSDRIRLSLRPGDVVSRLGGDEFAILLRSPADSATAGAVASRLLSLLREPTNVGGHEVFSSASVGIAIPEDGDTVEDLIRHADAAMYEAKGRGRDRWEVFDRSMREAVAQRIGMESDLRRAIDNDQLELFYQPELILETGAIVGVEALLRWHHPERGMLTAGEFVGLAEESGLIIDIGRWVLTQATRQGAAWRRRGHDIVTRVNLSARQLRPAVVDEVESALAESGLDPTALCLEITETAIMDDVEESERILLRFRELGCQIAVDDFGTGFSSLAYLKRFPVDILKIDRTFVDGVGVDPDDTAIVQSVIGLARTLRLEVVAEGIEDASQQQELVRLGCGRGQGFHLARPAPAATVEALLSSSLRR